MQVFAGVPEGLAGESPAVQGLAVVPGELAGESQAVQGLAVVPEGLPGESQAVQGLAVVPGKTVLLRGLAPAPPVSLATPRGQGSPLRFDTQPTG